MQNIKLDTLHFSGERFGWKKEHWEGSKREEKVVIYLIYNS